MSSPTASPTASVDSLSSQSLIAQSDTESLPDKPVLLTIPSQKTDPLPPIPETLPSNQLPMMRQQVNIMEFAGTQEDLIQPTEFLKNINHSFMSSGVTPLDEQKINAISL